MTPDDDSKTKRRTFLKASGALGITGSLAGCNSAIGEAMSQSDDTPESSNSPFTEFGNQWVTFGEKNAWGMRYNETTNELEIVHKPFQANSRRNIRIEADENGDKGDVYVDDSLIVENEVEVSDGSASDPSYNFVNQNDTGLWLERPGVLGITTASQPNVLFDNGTARFVGDVTANDERSTVVWDGERKHSPNLPAASARTSGDGSRRTFSLSHPLDTAPRVATVTPTSADAAGEFWVSDKTADSVEVTYRSPPPSGTENLSYDLVVSL